VRTRAQIPLPAFCSGLSCPGPFRSPLPSSFSSPTGTYPHLHYSIELTHSLAALSSLTAENSTHPAAPTIRSILHPPEVIDYVANGRNPDIYTREFVENVQRGNHVLNGKMQAFGSFAEIYARETKSAMPELAEAMDGVMERSGGFERQDGGAGDWKMKKRQVDGS
jgi:Transcription factor subunit Med10 of Mediator complex